jgi:uncharacterized OB-fold protein
MSQIWAPGLLPQQLDQDTLPFWEAARQHRLTYQTCDNCAHVVFYPRRHCPACLSPELTWRESAGAGSVYTFSVVRVSRDPRFTDRVPYTVAWIDLDEGVRMMSNVDGDPDLVVVGARVRVTWRSSGEWELSVFELEHRGGAGA